MTPRLHGAAYVLLVVALEDQPAGAHFAGAFVDVDGTATIELLERLPIGWRNLTSGEATTSLAMAAKYDDLVVTRLASEVAA